LDFLGAQYFSVKIKGKVIFTSARKLPWVPPVDAETESSRDLWKELCFGDAFVYNISDHQQGSITNKPFFASYLIIFQRAKLEY
jgi:hypothetical protein